MHKLGLSFERGQINVQLVVCWSRQFGLFEHILLLTGFSSDQCPEGFVAVSKSTLRIITVENVGETFNQSVVKLMYTPKKFVIHDTYRLLYVVESDHQSMSHPSSQKANGPHAGEENGHVSDRNMCPWVQF